MSPTEIREHNAPSMPKIDAWQKRSDVERRTEHDKRRRNSRKYFIKGGRERRTGNERRGPQERRDRWMRIDRWRSVPVFDK